MALSLKSRAFIGCAIAMSLFVGSGYLFVDSSKSYLQATQQRKQSFSISLSLEKLANHLKDAETGQRGFILTRREDYLGPFNNAVSKIDDDFERLYGLVPSNNLQYTLLQQLDTIARQKIKELEATVALTREGQSQRALEMVKTDQGRQLMGAARDLIDRIQDAETQRLLMADASMDHQSQRTFFIFWSSAGLALVLLGAVFLLLYQQMEARERDNVRLTEEMEQRKNAQDALEKQLQVVNSLNQELEAFSYSVSHDLRSPLRSISGFSNALSARHGAQMDAEGRDFLDRIVANTQRMGQLIDEMLKLSRLTRGEMRLELLDLTAMAERQAQECQEQDPERRVKFEIATDMKARGDRRLLEAVLQNLIGNAWKFTSQHPTACIQVKQKHEDDRVVYYVKDDGAGFEMEFVDKLFGAFQRLHAMHEFSGTGIGLATVQRIIHRHNGEIWAEGEPEKGATFYFTLNI
jgi:signal transduction histidine kinase